MKIEKNFKRLQRNDQISKVLGYLRGEGRVIPMIFDGKKCYGFLDERLFISTRLNTKQKIRGFDIKVEVVGEEISPEDAAREMIKSYCRFAPVGENDKNIYGYLKATTAIRELIQTKGGINVRKISDPVISLMKDEPMGKAINLLKNLIAVPLVDENNRLYGTIEKRYLIKFIADQKRPERGAYVSDKGESVSRPANLYSSKFAPTCAEDSELNEEVLGYLDDFGYCFACRGGEVKGIIAPLTILRALL